MTKVKQSKNSHKKITNSIPNSEVPFQHALSRGQVLKTNKTTTTKQKPTPQLKEFTQVFPLLTEEVPKLGESLPYCKNLMTSRHSLKISP